jgi:hypothetical protein
VPPFYGYPSLLHLGLSGGVPGRAALMALQSTSTSCGPHPGPWCPGRQFCSFRWRRQSAPSVRARAITRRPTARPSLSPPSVALRKLFPTASPTASPTPLSDDACLRGTEVQEQVFGDRATVPQEGSLPMQGCQTARPADDDVVTCDR